jgi:hypothetical protein
MAKTRPKKTARPKPAAARPSAKRTPPHRAAPSVKPKRPAAAKAPSKSVPAAPPPAPEPAPLPRNPDERRHVLSLSFVRDGDEFLARIETDTDQIIELKNRSLDQLLTLVASELEDLLE